MSGGNGKPAALSAEEAWLQATVGALLGTLQQFYPLEDQKKLARIAMFTVQEQAKLQQVTQAYITKEYEVVEFRLIEPTKLYLPGAPAKGAQLLAPMRVEDCKTLEEVIKCVTIFAILTSPLVQALLTKHGYKIAVGCGNPATEEQKKALQEDAKKKEV